jgi:hypothetical protein
MNKKLLNVLCLGAVVFWASGGYADQTLKTRSIVGRVLCSMQQGIDGEPWDGGIIPPGDGYVEKWTIILITQV